MTDQDQANGQPLRSIMDRAICLVIEFGGFGLSRKASTGSIVVNADKAMLALSKKLLKSKEHGAIVSLDLSIKKYLKQIALPSPMRNGTHLIPIPLVEEVERKLQAWRNERADLVEVFLAVYPQQLQDVQAELRDLYNPTDYPSCADLRGRYRLEWQYVDFGVPGKLKAISARLFEAERDKAATKLNEAAVEIKQALRTAFADLVSKMAQALGTTEDGKRRALRQSTLDNLAGFMQIFEMRNIADDAELAALVKTARELMAGKDREILKDDDVRQQIAQGFGTMADKLDTMIIDRGTRAIQLDDDEESVA